MEIPHTSHALRFFRPAKKNMVLAIFFILPFFFASSASAVEYIWDWNEPANDGYWRTASNWIPDGIPGNMDKVKIVTNWPLPPLIDSQTAAKAEYLSIGDGGGLYQSYGELWMDGGTLDVNSPGDSWMILGYGVQDMGVIFMDNGTITTSNRVYIGFNGQGVLFMDGGTFNIGGDLGIGTDGASAGVGNVNLNGGIITVAKLFFINTNGLSRLNVAGGTMIFAGDKVGQINDYIDEGLITAYDGTGTLSVVYSPGSNQTFLRAYHNLSKAGFPIPLNNGTGLSPYTDLYWLPATTAVSHKIYFGTTNPPPFVRNQTATTFDPCQLSLNTTYYWRIDEVTVGGSTITGDIWTFTTTPTFTTINFSDNFNDGALNSVWTMSRNWPATVKEANGVVRMSGKLSVPPSSDRYARLVLTTPYPFQSFELSVDYRMPMGTPDMYMDIYSNPFVPNQSGRWGMSFYTRWDWPGHYWIWWTDQDGQDGDFGGWGLGNENSIWHNLKLAYNAHTMTGKAYVDNVEIYSKTDLILSGFNVEFASLVGTDTPLGTFTIEFDNFRCVSEMGKLPPTASFTSSPQPQVVGQAVSFNGSGSTDADGTIVSYQWNFGDGNTASGPNSGITHAYAHSGTYYATLTVTDNDSLTNSVTQGVVIKTLAADKPDPANGVMIAPCDGILHWTSGLGAASHDIYFGTDAAAVFSTARLAGDLDASGFVDYRDLFILIGYWLSNPAGSVPYAGVNNDNIVDFNDFALLAANWRLSNLYMGNTVLTSYDVPGRFPLETTYYWRIDEVNGTQITKGNLWSFTTTSVDSNYTLVDKVMAGYQGWFNAPGDGTTRGWVHWGSGDFSPTNCTVDMWPDMSEYGSDEKYLAEGFFDGTDHYVFSSHNRNTVLRHFQWMQQYGIDGVYLQRFATELSPGSPELTHRNDVLSYCRDGANTFGKKYAVMYDLSNLGLGGTQIVVNDWKFLVDTYRIGRDPCDNGYMFHKGKPVVAVWGIGFNDGRLYTLQECLNLVNFLKNDPVYGGNVVMLGVPSNWRSLSGDCVSDPLVHDIVRAADIVSPWSVGRYSDTESAAGYATSVWIPDVAWCTENNVEYLPVIFPGFSWKHKMGGQLNAIPRNAGQFLWDQVYQTVSAASANMIYVAMFDEFDEGTAILKFTNTPPTTGGIEFVTPSIDGIPLPSDEYLWLTGKAGQALRGEIPLNSLRPSR